MTTRDTAPTRCKEEYDNWARQFVRRGIAALTIDGPGQGAMVGILPMRPEAWERPMGAIIDALTACGKVDARRIGIWGSSLGGFLVLRAAAYEPRLQAAISLGGFYEVSMAAAPRGGQRMAIQRLGGPAPEARRGGVEEKFTLDHAVERIEAAYLVIHGGRDDLLTVEEGQQMATGPRGEFVNFADGFHTCTNYNATLVPLMCDWMATRWPR